MSDNRPPRTDVISKRELRDAAEKSSLRTYQGREAPKALL